MARSHPGGFLVAVALAGACGAGSAIPATEDVVEIRSHAAILRLDSGRQMHTFSLHEPSGVILLYRLSAPPGASFRATAQLPGVTVPLRIATTPLGPSSSCTEEAGRVDCTVGEEWCPMPEGTWRFRVEKVAGPAGVVTLWFRVGVPPRQA
jgi:hypothetical protein